jgi:hypothetical protein
MPDKVIAARLQVDTGNSNPEIKEVNKNLSDVKSSLKETSTAAKGTGKDISETGGHFSNLKDKISSLPGPLGQAGESVGSLSSSFKALIANPVGLVILAIVAALAFLYKAFTNTFEGGQKVEQIFAGIKAAAQVVMDRVLDLGGAIIKFFSGDFKGAMTDAKKAVTGVGDEVAKVYGRTAELTKQLQNIKKEERQDEIEKSEREKRLALLREQLNDDSVPRAKRIALAKELKADEDKNAIDDLDRAKRKGAVLIELAKQGKDGAQKNADEIAQIQIGINKTQTENALEGVRTNKVIRNLEKQDEAEAKAAYQKGLEERKAALAKYKAEQKKITEEGNKAIQDAEKVLEKGLDRDGQLALLKKEYDAKLELARKANLNLLKIREAYQFERNELEAKYQKEDDDKEKVKQDSFETFLKGRAAITMAWLSADSEAKKHAAEEEKATDDFVRQNKIDSYKAITDASTALAEIIGQQTIVGKALGIATALINTYQGASEALKQKSTLPSPFDVIAKVAAVATIIATGLKTVSAITQVKIPGGSGGGVSAPSISAPAPVAPTASSTLLQQGILNNTGSAAAPVAAYVIESQGRNSTETITRLNRAARLG